MNLVNSLNFLRAHTTLYKFDLPFIELSGHENLGQSKPTSGSNYHACTSSVVITLNFTKEGTVAHQHCQHMSGTPPATIGKVSPATCNNYRDR